MNVLFWVLCQLWFFQNWCFAILTFLMFCGAFVRGFSAFPFPVDFSFEVTFLSPIFGCSANLSILVHYCGTHQSLGMDYVCNKLKRVITVASMSWCGLGSLGSEHVGYLDCVTLLEPQIGGFLVDPFCKAVSLWGQGCRFLVFVNPLFDTEWTLFMTFYISNLYHPYLFSLVILCIVVQIRLIIDSFSGNSDLLGRRLW